MKKHKYLLILILFINTITGCTCIKNTIHTENEYVLIETGKNPKEKVVKDSILVGSTVKPQEIPEFPFPPPAPSATDELPRSFFSSCTTLDDINVQLSNSLYQCGYISKRYFHVPNGFALVTQLERINADGSPRLQERWNIQAAKDKVFSIRDYFESLFYANPGSYRCIVFVITDRYYAYSTEDITRDQTLKWLQIGVNRLPGEIGKIKLSPEYSVDVLIYEFKKNEKDSAAVLSAPSLLQGREHLIKSNIISYLRTYKK